MPSATPLPPTLPRPVAQEHFVIHTSVDLRRVWREDGSSTLVLRVLVGRRWSANLEGWSRKPLLRLAPSELREPDKLCAETRAWLLRYAIDCQPEAAEKLRGLAEGTLHPTIVRVVRRQLRSAMPRDRDVPMGGVILEQSDVYAGGRVWRTVSVEGSSVELCHRTVTSLRDSFPPDSLEQSAPLFARTVAATEAAGVVEELEGGGVRAGSEPRPDENGRYNLAQLLTHLPFWTCQKWARRSYRISTLLDLGAPMHPCRTKSVVGGSHRSST